MKTVLIQNFHPANTMALVKDFVTIGYEVVMPIDSWGGRIKYYFENGISWGARLITYEDYMLLPPGDVLVACFEQQDDFERIAIEHGDRILLHTAGNNVPYRHGLSQHLLSPDIQTYNNYPAQNKMLYWFPPTIQTTKQKDLEQSFNQGLICAYVHYYEQYWQESFNEALEFERLRGTKVYLYGHQTRDGALLLDEAQSKMAESFFTLYFKEKDCYGNAVIESMWLGTPVIALRRFISDKTLGMFFLNDQNSILVDSPQEAIARLKTMTFEQYATMSKYAQVTVRANTDDVKRLSELKEMLAK